MRRGNANNRPRRLGYIGGEALYSLYEAHPEFEYALLVRNADRGKPVAEQYPKARLVYGSLTDGEVIEKEAVAADIVIRMHSCPPPCPSLPFRGQPISQRIMI